MNLRRLHDLIQRVDVLELTVGVVCAVAVVLLGDLCEVLELGAVFVHVLLTCITKEPGCKRCTRGSF